MSTNRDSRTQVEASAPVLVAETLRNSIPMRPDQERDKPASSEERMSPMWRIFGGTLLSIAALVVITVCQYFNSALGDLRAELGRVKEDLRKEMTNLNTDLRKDLGRLNEAQGETVRKEEFNTRVKSVWDSLKELQGLSATVNALKERDLLRDQHQREEQDRKELIRELQTLRERLAHLEGQQTPAKVETKLP